MDVPVTDVEKEEEARKRDYADDSDAHPRAMRMFLGGYPPMAQPRGRDAVVNIDQDLPLLWSRYKDGSFSYLDWNLAEWMTHQRVYHKTAFRVKKKIIKRLLREGGIMAAHREAMQGRWVFAENRIIRGYIGTLTEKLHLLWTRAGLEFLRPYPDPINEYEAYFLRKIGTDRLDLLNESGSSDVWFLVYDLEWIPNTVSQIRQGAPVAHQLVETGGMDRETAQEIERVLREPPQVLHHLPGYTDTDQVPDRVPYRHAITTCLYVMLVLGWMGVNVDGTDLVTSSKIIETVNKYGTLAQRAAVQVTQSYYRVCREWQDERKPAEKK